MSVSDQGLSSSEIRFFYFFIIIILERKKREDTQAKEGKGTQRAGRQLWTCSDFKGARLKTSYHILAMCCVFFLFIFCFFKVI